MLSDSEKARIHKIIMSEKFGIDAYTLDNLLGDDLGLDSITIIDMIMELEEEFGVNLIEQVGHRPTKYSVQNIYDLVDNCLHL